MSAPQNNLKEIFNAGRERSINALINDIKTKYKAYLASGRDEYTYIFKWTEPGYFMSPFIKRPVCDDSHVSPDANYINGTVSEREMCIFMSEVTRALEKHNIYASNSSCKYKSSEASNIHYMIIQLSLSLIKPQKYSQSSDY